MLVLGMDPGERCGWAVAEITDDGEFRIVKRGVSPLRNFAMKLHESAPKYDVLLYETWRLRPDMAKKLIGNDFQPSQLIGMIRLCAWVHGVPLVSQSPNIKKTALKTMPEELRESLGESSEQHDKDAIMHCWHYYWERYIAKTK